MSSKSEKPRVLGYLHYMIGNDYGIYSQFEPHAEFGVTSYIVELIDKQDFTALQKELEAHYEYQKGGPSRLILEMSKCDALQSQLAEAQEKAERTEAQNERLRQMAELEEVKKLRIERDSLKAENEKLKHALDCATDIANAELKKAANERDSLKVENAKLVLHIDDIEKANDNCQNKIVALESANKKLREGLGNLIAKMDETDRTSSNLQWIAKVTVEKEKARKALADAGDSNG